MTATRDRILEVAEELYVLRGHDGFSFGDIAAAVEITRANIHHHFGNKQRLMAELLERFAADAQRRILQHWAAPGRRFSDRLQAQRADLEAFYDRFNPTAGTRNVWSPVARIRLDLPVLGERAIAALERVNRAYDQALGAAVAEAIGTGEFRKDTEADAIIRLLRVTFLSCGPVTQDTGSFAELGELLAALARTITAAWGRRPSRSSR